MRRLFEPYFYYEDAELSVRTILAGGNIGYVTSSRFQHYSSTEYGIRSPPEAWQKSKNLARFEAKHKILTISTHFRIGSSFKLLVIHSIYLFLLCLTQRNEVVKNTAMIQGTFEGICSLGRLQGPRTEFSRIKKRDDEYLFARLYLKPDSKVQRIVQSFLIGSKTVSGSA